MECSRQADLLHCHIQVRMILIDSMIKINFSEHQLTVFNTSLECQELWRATTLLGVRCCWVNNMSTASGQRRDTAPSSGSSHQPHLQTHSKWEPTHPLLEHLPALVAIFSSQTWVLMVSTRSQFHQEYLHSSQLFVEFCLVLKDPLEQSHRL